MEAKIDRYSGLYTGIYSAFNENKSVAFQCYLKRLTFKFRQTLVEGFECHAKKTWSKSQQRNNVSN